MSVLDKVTFFRIDVTKFSTSSLPKSLPKQKTRHTAVVVKRRASKFESIEI